MRNMDISLIIPVRNAESIIEKTLLAYEKFLSFCRHEIIVVCNGILPSDKTTEIARNFARKNKNIIVIELEKRGKGLAILAGFKKARYKVIGFMDADNVFDLKAVKNMLAELEKYDCIIASKRAGRNFFAVKEYPLRKFFAFGWNMLSFFLLGLRFADTQAGCKFLKREAFSAIDKNFICLGFDFDVELLYKLKKAGCKIKETYVPIREEKETISTFRFRFVPVMFWHILRLWSKK